MLLARSAGPVYQDRHVGRSHQPDVFVESARGIAPPFDIVERRGGRGRLRRTPPGVFRLHGGLNGLLQRFADLFEQFVGIHRLGHVVTGPEFHAAHRVLNLGIARHDDHRGFDPRTRHPLQQGDPVLVGQAHITQHQRKTAVTEGRACGCDRRRGLHVEAAFREPRAQHQRKRNIIVYNQNPFHNTTKLAFFPLPQRSHGFSRSPSARQRSALRRPLRRGFRPAAGLRPPPGPRAS